MGYAGQLIVERSAEELLLEFERTGRPEPFEEIVRRYSGMVFHVCHRICRDKHDAEDATQAVFAALAVGRKKESGEIRAIGPWLRQVARRVSLDIRRGQKRRQRRETLCASDGTAVDDTPEPSTGGLDAEEIKQLVKEELERMPVKYRLPLILHYFGGMSQDDMAKELGCRPGTLRVRLHRARGMLAKRLAKRGVAAGGGLAAVVFVVAVTRAVQSAVTDSLAVQFGYGHAATAGGVIHAATGGGPVVAAAQGVASSKLKVACAVVLVGACVVRAGAEVYEYIRPLQLQMPSVPVPVNLDQLVKPLFDTLMPPMHVDAAPAKPVRDGWPGNVAIPDAWPAEVVVRSVPVAAPAVVPVVGASGAHPVVAQVGTVGQPVASGGGTGFVARPIGRVGPEYSPVGAWTSAQAAAGGSGGNAGRGGSGAVTGAGGVSVAAVRAWTPFSMPTAQAAPPVAPPAGGYEPPTSAPPPVTTPVVPPVETPPVVQNPSTPQPAPGGQSGGTPVVVAAAIVLQPTSSVVTPPVAPKPPPVPADGGTPPASLSLDGALLASSAPQTYAMQFSVSTVSSSVRNLTSSDTAQLSAVPSTPAPPYRVSAKGLTGAGKVSASELDNSGVVAATTSASPAMLDLSGVGGVTNSVDNPPTGRNGWYVGSQAKLMLPKIAVQPGTNAYSWGESATDTTPDLVNSVRMTLNDVAAAGDVRVSLVSPDWPGVPTFPPGQHAIAVWALESDAAIRGGIDLLVRFDAFKTYALGGTDADVRLMDYTAAGWRSVDDGSFATWPDQHVVGGRVGDVTYFAVAVPQAVTMTVFSGGDIIPSVTPEPACLSLIAGGMFLLRRRPRGKM